MDWKKLIRELMAAGVKQAEIAEKCGVSQGTVSDLLRLDDREPRFDFGTRLVALHRERVNGIPAEPPSTAPHHAPTDHAAASDTDRAMHQALTQRSTDRIVFGAAQPPASDRANGSGRER